MDPELRTRGIDPNDPCVIGKSVGRNGYAHSPSARHVLGLGRWPDDPRVTDHLCRNRACIRRDHLEAVTFRENMRRGASGRHSRRECRECHKRTLRLRSDGARRCGACDTRRRNREWNLVGGAYDPEA